VSFGFVDPWHSFLPRDGGHVLGFMGSGGKTSLLRAIAEFYADQDTPTVLTTTTRSEILPGLTAYTWAELQVADLQTLPTVFYVHGGEIEPGKWGGLAADQVDALGGLLPDRVVLVEVDGAAKQPLKFYRPGEPVWPSRTSLAFVVMGVGAVGGRISAAVHRWGRVPFTPLADIKDYALLEWCHLKELLLADGGYLSQVPPGVPAVLSLAGLAVQDDSIGLFEFVGQAMAHPSLPLVMFCSRGEKAFEIRTAYVERQDGSS